MMLRMKTAKRDETRAEPDSSSPHASPDSGAPNASSDSGAPEASSFPAAVTLSPDSSAPFQALGFVVSSVGYAVAKRFRATLAPLGLEPREFALLRAVGAAEGQSQQAVGERLQIPPSRMVAFVDGLEERSLLERRQNPHDRRTRALYLTTEGRALLERAFTLAFGLERDLCAELSDSEREQLLELLQRVALRVGLATGPDSTHAHSALRDE
jgi:DNA-binding MarR family transcriptional regulator